MEYMPLFVYGTLMRGESNHGLLRSARFVAEDILPGAQLYDLGPYPMILQEPGQVYGERYLIPLNVLSAIDDLEDHPKVYQRQWLQLVSGEFAWVYMGQPQLTQGYSVIASGQWRYRVILSSGP